MTKIFDPIIEVHPLNKSSPDKYLWVNEVRVLTPYYISNIGTYENYGYVKIPYMRHKLFVAKGNLKQDGVMITDYTWTCMSTNKLFRDIYHKPTLFYKFVNFLIENTSNSGLFNTEIISTDQKDPNQSDWRIMTENGTIWMYANGERNRKRIRSRIDKILNYFLNVYIHKQKQKKVQFAHKVRFTNEIQKAVGVNNNKNLQCIQHTVTGNRCKRKAVKGRKYCRQHMPDDVMSDE